MPTRIYFPKLFILLFLSSLFVSCSATKLARNHPNAVNNFKKVEIGGVRQAVMVRGHNIYNPVMVFLHGGPGVPLFPFEPMGETMSRLEQEFTMVYWEQRGTGKSFSHSISPSSMNVDQFIEDTRQVVEYARNLTGQQKVFIWGHSWGSNIGALFASKYPELVHAYISTGQSVNPFQNERLNYEFALKKAIEENNPRALRELVGIDTIAENYSIRDALVVRKWVYRYGGVVKTTDNERPYFDLYEVHRTLTSPFYSLGDRINMLLFPYYSVENLWEDLKELNLKNSAPRIEVPVYFLVGRHDIIVSADLANSYFEMLDAPNGKTLVWFENSAHRPHREEREKFLELIKQRVLWEVLDYTSEPETWLNYPNSENLTD